VSVARSWWRAGACGAPPSPELPSQPRRLRHEPISSQRGLSGSGRRAVKRLPVLDDVLSRYRGHYETRLRV
jgi:hypothetical protein